MAKKFDQGKERMDLVDPLFVLQIARVLTHGAEKYGENNWQELPDAEKRYMAALLRHINQYQRGIKIDSESGEWTLAHAACNLMFLFWSDTRRNNEPKALRPDGCQVGPGDAPSCSAPESGDEADSDENTKFRQTAYEVIDEILDPGGPHVAARARLRDFCYWWRQSGVLSSDYEAPDWKLH